MDKDNIYNQLKQLLEKSGGNFNILEEQIDVDLQVEFFEMIDTLKKEEDDESGDDFGQIEKSLNSTGTDLNEKKRTLAKLSNIENPEAFRIIERFTEQKNKDLDQWTTLALQHCRINLESHFLDEQQVFISTGLGGKDEKLRYFIACKIKEGKDITDAQRKMVATEFDTIFSARNSVVEKIKHSKSYFSLVGLIPIDISINEVIKEAIDETNSYGDFIHSKFLVTNVKILQKSEIEKYFKNLGL